MSWTQKILCRIYGHQWENFMTYVPVRAGPLMSTMCKRCGEHGSFPDNLPQTSYITYNNNWTVDG